MGEPGAAGGGGGGSGSQEGEPRSLEDLDPEVVAGMTADELKKFIDTGRSGRRNALPDVTQPEIVTASTAGVAEALESLSVQSGNPSLLTSSFLFDTFFLLPPRV